MKFKILFLLFFLRFLNAKDFIFDKVQWFKVDEKDEISLFISTDKEKRINFYKAEKVIKDNNAYKFFLALLDFDNYPKIFPRTEVFQKVKEVSENRYIIYSIIDFSPLKKRDYFILLEYYIEKSQNDEKYILQWYPICENEEIKIENKNYVRVETVYGRWSIVKNIEKIKISVEYYNDFKLNVPAAFRVPFEKESTIEALNNLISYSAKH